jgi:YD repeat-containing protein
MKRTLSILILTLASFGLAIAQTPAINYSYDPAGRLTGIDYGNGTTIMYTYDNAGNLLSRSVTTPSPAPTAIKANDRATPEGRHNSKSRNGTGPAASARNRGPAPAR